MSKQKTKTPVPRAPGSAPTKSTSASTPAAEQLLHLRSLLTQAGYFPRPTGRRGYRVVDHDPIPEGHEEVALVRSDRRENSTPKKGQRFADIVATKHGMTAQQIGTKSFLFEATDDDGAAAIDAAFQAANNRESRIVRIVPAGTPAPKGWAIEQRRPSPIDAREDAVRPLLEQLHEVVPAMMNNGVLPSPKVWRQVLADDLLDEDTVSTALATIEPKDNRDEAQGGVVRTKAWHFLRVLGVEKLSLQQVVLRAFNREVNSDDKEVMAALVKDERVQTDKRGRGSLAHYWLEAQEQEGSSAQS